MTIFHFSSFFSFFLTIHRQNNSFWSIFGFLVFFGFSFFWTLLLYIIVVGGQFRHFHHHLITPVTKSATNRARLAKFSPERLLTPNTRSLLTSKLSACCSPSDRINHTPDRLASPCVKIPFSLALTAFHTHLWSIYIIGVSLIKITFFSLFQLVLTPTCWTALICGSKPSSLLYVTQIRRNFFFFLLPYIIQILFLKYFVFSVLKFFLLPYIIRILLLRTLPFSVINSTTHSVHVQCTTYNLPNFVVENVLGTDMDFDVYIRGAVSEATIDMKHGLWNRLLMLTSWGWAMRSSRLSSRLSTDDRAARLAKQRHRVHARGLLFQMLETAVVGWLLVPIQPCGDSTLRRMREMVHPTSFVVGKTALWVKPVVSDQWSQTELKAVKW